MTATNHQKFTEQLKSYASMRGLFIRTHLIIDTMCHRNDEIHLRGQLKRDIIAGNGTPLTRFDFVGAEWLDLAVAP